MHTVQTEKRVCLDCGNPLRGRVDKKFCNDYCRNHFNNETRARSGFSPYIRSVNNCLQRNRKIMAGILGQKGDTAKTTRDQLLQMGFHFRYFTHLYTTKKGRDYYYCYEYGYLPLANDWFLIVKKKEE